MDDFGLLGIPPTRDRGLVKKAFRARAKELHPDLAPSRPGEDPIERHLRFAALNQAYGRVLSTLSALPESPPAAPPEAARGDPAYALYRKGMDCFMAIHPSAWYSIDEAKDEELRARVRELIRLFPRAYYFFSLVASEFPDSPWAPDARDKIAAIERRTPSYERIAESFGAYRRAGRERGLRWP